MTEHPQKLILTGGQKQHKKIIIKLLLLNLHCMKNLKIIYMYMYAISKNEESMKHGVSTPISFVVKKMNLNGGRDVKPNAWLESKLQRLSFNVCEQGKKQQN